MEKRAAGSPHGQGVSHKWDDQFPRVDAAFAAACGAHVISHSFQAAYKFRGGWHFLCFCFCDDLETNERLEIRLPPTGQKPRLHRRGLVVLLARWKPGRVLIGSSGTPEVMKKPASTGIRILIADDQADVREALVLLFKAEGYQSETADSPGEALELLRKEEFSLVLVDLNYTRDTTSGQEGIELLPRIQELDPAVPVVVMTAWANVQLAVEAMRRGARDFVQKPWDNVRLLTIVRTQIEFGQACARATGWKRKTRCCAANHAPTSSLIHPPCGLSWN